MKPLLLLMLIPFAGAESCPRMPCKNGGTCLKHSNGTSTCLCSPGYVGDTCQFADPCTPVLCQNGGSCSSRALPPPAAPEYVCACPPGFTGEKCQGAVGDPCFPSPCQHGGTCQRISRKEHQCQCLPGWTGKNCQLMDFCPANPCANGGTCVITYPFIVCQCWPGFEGHTCQHDINECFASPSPCLNGGSCINSIGSFRCLCPSNFSGPLCQYRRGPCFSEICLHGGTCHHVDGGYHGCLCLPGNYGYTGQYCEVNPDDCAGHQCLNGGTCQDGIGTYTCHCIQGWTGLLCHLPDACLSNPCHHDAHCDTDLQTGHAICTCQLGYAGALCYEDIDECRMGSNPCEHRGSCYNTPGSFTCSCLRGYTGSRCESNLNECLSQPCQNGASCLDLLDRFQCLCPSGFGGPLCEVEECLQGHCLNGGTCVLQSHGPACLCPPGFEGLQCERDADFCRDAPCEHGTCVNAPGSFTCVCAPGFTGSLCNELSDPCWAFQCLNGGSCRGTESGPLCTCSPGWTGQMCDTEVNACNSSPCHQRATCLSRQGSFQCICPSGYVGAACDADEDECSSSPCLNSGTCLNSPGSFHCLCPRGYSGPKCQDTLDLCSDYICKNGGRCRVKESAPHCFCPPGWGGPHCQHRTKQNGDNCTDQTGKGGCQVKRLNPKIRSTAEPNDKGNKLPFAGRFLGEVDQTSCLPTQKCLNGGTCTKTTDGFRCLCPPGTKGPNCHLDPCSLASPPCYYGGTCVAQSEGFLCICPTGYVGERCQGVVDACFSQPCHLPGTQSCQSDEHGFHCLCNPGYSGLLCESVIDSCQSNPCLNGGSCSVLPKNPLEFTCRCPQGYDGSTCDVPAPPCGSSYCHNGGICIARPSGPRCLCKEGFSGPDCHQPPCSSASCPAANATTLARCPSLARDAHCDRICSSPETSWDGGDCALGLLNPWENCPKRDLCQRVFRDGHCQPPCDNEECLYDGFDCVPQKECNPSYARYCWDRFSDGHCDRGCHSASCGWDGGDCASSVPPIESTLALVVLLPRESVSELLRSLVVATRAELRIQRDRQHRERIYPYTGKEELGSQSNWTGIRTKDLAETVGYTIFLVVEGSSCQGQCPASAKSALNLLGSLMAKGILSSLIPHRVVAAWFETVENDPEPSSSHFSGPLVYCVGVGALILALVIFIGMWRIRRPQHREHGSLWLPPGFAPRQGKKRRCRRDPVGEDAIRLKPTKLSTEFAEDHDIFSNPHFDGTLNPKDIQEDLDSVPISDQGLPKPKTQMLGNVAVPNLGKDTRPKAAKNQEPVCGLTPPMSLACSSGLKVESSWTDKQMENFGETPLHLAARYSRADAARRLLTVGADVNARDQWGRTPLHSAIAADALGVFQILLRQRQTELDASADDGTTPLILATRLGVENMVEELVANHADIHAIDKRGKSALHWAAAVNNVRAALVLLRNGADKDVLDNQAQTPLFLAAREGSYQVADLLLQHGAKQNLRNHTGHLPKDVALERLHHDILSLLDRSCLPPGTGQLSPHRPRPQPSSKLHRWPYPTKSSQLTPVPENEGPFKDATPSEEAMGQTVE